MAGEDRAPVLEGLTGDAEHDDALLEATGGEPAAFERALRDRDVPESRLEAVERAYRRWGARAGDRGTPAGRAIRGALGFWLMTVLMVRWTSGQARDEEAPDWPALQRRLDALFGDPHVRGCFASLYLPPADLELGTATVHRLGTTSFILHCLKADNTRDPIALKCLLYPYTGNRQIALATREYERRYAPTATAAKAHMPRVYRSSEAWIEMDFIEGRTLAELLAGMDAGGEPAALSVRLDRVRRYGLPLLTALCVLPVAHLDLSPSNVIVQERESEDGTATVAHVYLVDFGENYLLTQDVGSGRIGAADARFVAPELLHSRGRRERSGREDVFSVGQLLLSLAGFASGDGGFIPTRLHEDVPFLAPIVEDLVDRAPDRRLLLMDGGHDPDVPPGDLYRALRHRLREGLAAQETLAPMSPTLAMSRRPGGPAGRLLARLGSLPHMVGAVRRPLEFAAAAQLLDRRRGPAAGDTDSRYLFWWVFACSCGWLAIWLVVGGGLVSDLLHTSLLPDPQDVLRSTWPLVDLRALAAHYQALYTGPPRDWQGVLGRLVVLSFGVTAARYYLDIFATLTTRRLRSTRGRRRVEAAMRLTALGFGPGLVALSVWLLSDWMLATAGLMLWIVLNNYLSCELATRLAQRGERAFSTIRDSDLRENLDKFSEWWKLMLAYCVALIALGVLVRLGFARDVWVYALAVIALNMIKLYRSNCGKLAPGVRASLRRAYVTGERLESLDRRAGTAR
jgi:hypothetical protein